MPTIQQITTALKSALEGEIYESIRAITFSYDPLKQSFKLYYYLDREPSEDNFDNIGIVTTEFIAHFPDGIDTIEELCIHYGGPIEDIDAMDGMVYVREEA